MPDRSKRHLNLDSNSRWPSSGPLLLAMFALMVILIPAGGFAEVGISPTDTSVPPPADTGVDSDVSSDADLDASDVSTPAKDTTLTDAKQDSNTSADTSDGADTVTMDAAEDAAADDAMTTDAMSPDVGGDAGDAGQSGPATLSGRVDVKFADDNSLVEVELSPDFAGWSRTRTTGASGEFSFKEIPTGVYQLTFSRSDYVQVGYTLDVRGDRVLQVSMFPDQSVTLRADAIFDGDSPPDSVEFTMTGERGDLSPADPISVESGTASWTRDDVPVGNWRLTATADGYLETSFELGVRAPESANQGGPSEYHVRLQMIPEDREADSVSTGDGGCGCRDEDSRGGGGGRIPGGFGPGAMLLIGWLALRRWVRH